MHASRLSVDSLLSRLRYPGAPRQGVAAWGPDPATDRHSAWVKWNGKEVSAEFTHGNAREKGATLSVHWEVSGAGEVRIPQDQASLLEVEKALERFASIDPADTPSFITLPAPPRRPRP